jgi:hypothetical protein
MKPPRKSSGELGVTKVTGQADGTVSAEIIHAHLPSDKEGLERVFAAKFVEWFNATRPHGPSVAINDLRQNDTSDLDFSVSSSIADYLELAEINPRSEAFGRNTLRTGRYNVYTFARWVWLKLIKKKQNSYDRATTPRTILLLYSTYWQFQYSDRTIECLRAITRLEGCSFAAVYLLKTNTTDLMVVDVVHPGAPPPERPKQFAGFTVTNLPPGQASHVVPTAHIPAPLEEN